MHKKPQQPPDHSGIGSSTLLARLWSTIWNQSGCIPIHNRSDSLSMRWPEEKKGCRNDFTHLDTNRIGLWRLWTWIYCNHICLQGMEAYLSIHTLPYWCLYQSQQFDILSTPTQNQSKGGTISVTIFLNRHWWTAFESIAIRLGTLGSQQYVFQLHISFRLTVYSTVYCSLFRLLATVSFDYLLQFMLTVHSCILTKRTVLFTVLQ